MERRRPTTDHILFNVILALLVIGVVMVYDASYAQSMDHLAQGHDGFFFLKKQALYAFLGMGAMLGMVRFGYWRLKSLAVPLLLVSCLLLIAVWIPGLGIHRNGAARWLGKGALQFQPSELAKLVLIVYLAALLARNIEAKRFDIQNFKDGLLAPLLVVAFLVLLVEREPDMGTAAVMALTSVTLFFFAGARKTHLAAVCGVGACLFLMMTLMHGFRGDRLKTFLNPDADKLGKGFQIYHGVMAVGSGGIKGVGIGAGREKFYLPEANTDFIFATIAEETGFIGSVTIIGLLLVVSWRAMVIARRTRDTFGSLLAAGIGAMISWQALINIAVVTGSVPATGVPLPFISFGGTSLVFLLGSVGILLNIAQHPDALKADAARPRTEEEPLLRVGRG
jgi:cell division protein FtsW